MEDADFTHCQDFESICSTLELNGFAVAAERLRSFAMPKRQKIADWAAPLSRYRFERSKKIRASDGRLESKHTTMERIHPEFPSITFDQMKRAIEKPD